MNSNLAIIAAVAIAVGAEACGEAPDDSTHADRVAIQSNGLMGGAVIPSLSQTPTSTGSTVPSNGDLNPYGVAFVPAAFPNGGLLHPGDVIVSNFNNSANLQGTGTTIVRVNPNASPTTFFANTANVGLSTALGVLGKGFVLVANVPSTDGSGACTEGPNGQEENVGSGKLLVIDRNGRLVQTLASAALLNGPWDLTLQDFGAFAEVFVSNALSGSVTRLDLAVGDRGVTIERETQIASRYTHRCDPAAFVVGPTGLALDAAHDVLYVASTADNEIFAVPNATTTLRDDGQGHVAVRDTVHLHGPLGLALAANGDLISAQSDAVNPDPNQTSEIVEFSPQGKFVAEFSIDPAPGSAFGLALEPISGGFRFAAVDDGRNVLDEWLVN
jgi:sugar lactone lactonase YvrE